MEGLRYVLPVLWMTSCFRTTDLWRVVTNLRMSAVLEQVTNVPAYPPGCATLFDFVVVG